MGPPLRKGRKPYTRAYALRPYKKRETPRRAVCAEAEPLHPWRESSLCGTFSYKYWKLWITMHKRPRKSQKMGFHLNSRNTNGPPQSERENSRKKQGARRRCGGPSLFLRLPLKAQSCASLSAQGLPVARSSPRPLSGSASPTPYRSFSYSSGRNSVIVPLYRFGRNVF